MTTHHPSGINRRSVARGVAWAAPTIICAAAAPAHAASPRDGNDHWPPNVTGPWYIDQSKAGTATTPLFNDAGDFHFLIPCRSGLPSITWVAQLVPVPNAKGKVVTSRRDFRAQKMQGGGGSAVNVSLIPSGTTYSDYAYNSTTGVETLTFTTAAYDDSQRQVKQCTLKIGVGFVVSGTAFPCLNDKARFDKLVVRGYLNGDTSTDPVFFYDSWERASKDKREGVCKPGHDDNQDGLI